MKLQTGSSTLAVGVSVSLSLLNCRLVRLESNLGLQTGSDNDREAKVKRLIWCRWTLVCWILTYTPFVKSRTQKWKVFLMLATKERILRQ